MSKEYCFICSSPLTEEAQNEHHIYKKLAEQNRIMKEALEHYNKMYSNNFVTAIGPSGSFFEDSREIHRFDIGQVARHALRDCEDIRK